MIESITLKNYRSYKDVSFEFTEGVTIIIGPNASGKTNLLEAVYLLAQGTGFRSSDKDLINNESSWARLEGYINKEERVIKLETAEPRTKKTIQINDTNKAKLSFNEAIPIVLFEPDDVRIIGGSPERRRDYIDTLLCNTSAHYKKNLAGYKRSLKQRNTLLKNALSSDSLFAWNTVLARYAQEVVNERLALVEKLTKHISDIYSELSNTQSKIEVNYTSALHTDNYLNVFLHKLEKNFELDKERGFTAIGPHRDDIFIKLNNKDAGVFASRGEARTITLGLKVIEQQIIEEVRGKKPLLLLDDVFSELDGARRRMLTKSIGGYQSIITTTDADVVGKKFASSARIITLD